MDGSRNNDNKSGAKPKRQFSTEEALYRARHAALMHNAFCNQSGEYSKYVKVPQGWTSFTGKVGHLLPEVVDERPKNNKSTKK